MGKCRSCGGTFKRPQLDEYEWCRDCVTAFMHEQQQRAQILGGINHGQAS